MCNALYSLGLHIVLNHTKTPPQVKTEGDPLHDLAGRDDGIAAWYLQPAAMAPSATASLPKRQWEPDASALLTTILPTPLPFQVLD